MKSIIRSIIKLLKIAVISFVLLMIASVVYVSYFDESEALLKTKDKGELFTSMTLYIGACNEIIKGKNEIYIKDSIYTMYDFNGKETVYGEEMVIFFKEQWESADAKAERKKSEECLASKDKRNAKFKAKQKQQKDIKNLKKELKDAIDDL